MALPMIFRRLQGARRGAQRQLVVPVTVALWTEDDQWIARVLELEVASQGDSQKEALEEAMDAACAYLNTLEELGERERVFAERSIASFETAPATLHPASVSADMASRPDFQLRQVSLPVNSAFA